MSAFHVSFRDVTMAALLAAKEIIATDLAELAAYPDEWDFASGSVDVLRIQEEQVDAELSRRQRLTLPPIEHGGPDAATVKTRVDIITVIERYTNLRKAGRTYRARCPIHDGVSDGSLAVYPD